MKHADADHGKPKRTAQAGTRKAAAAPSKAGAEAVAPRLTQPLAAMARASFVSLSTRPGGGRSEPIVYANNPVGDALISTGLASFASAAVGAIGPLLPVGMSGIRVKETLHRLDANAQPPTLERGVTSANRVGEALGSISMRWLLAPDEFEATPSTAPPSTEIRSGHSQRFVMHEGLVTFQDRGQGGLRFFGAGRTYPATVDSRPRLFFAGTGVVVEGIGSLKGVRGTLTISGEITRPAGIAMTLVGRFDSGGPVDADDSLGPLLDAAGDQPAVVFTLAGAANAASEDGVERLAVARIGNDVPNATHLRSVFRVGTTVGTASGPIVFDAAEHRCAVPLEGMRRTLVFSDGAGRRVGAVTLDGLEGTSLREQHDGAPVNRTVAYGRIADGAGALANATGVATIDTATEESGTISSLYVLRLADPGGRFRAPVLDAYKPAPPPSATVAPPPPPVDALAFVEGSGAAINAVDRTIVSYADRTLADGLELTRWWEAKDRVGDYVERFDVVREYSENGRSFGFFDTAVVSGADLPVMGIVQEMFYDRQKMATGETIRAQLQEFVLRYFMRVSHFRQPEAVPGDALASQSTLERAISWLPGEEERRVGFGFQQLYYKRHDSGKIGKFTADEQNAIVDLREIGAVYDWILLKVDIFDFNLQFAPFGAGAPKLQVPLKESTYLVLGPSFVRNVENPEPGVLGEYGYGYAFVPYAPEPGMIAYGPGHFAAAIQTVHFRVMDDGEIRVRAAFVVNRPTKIANVDVAPLDWGFQLADLMTFKMASRLMSPAKAVADRLPLRVTGVDPISAYIWMANTVTGGLAEKRFGVSKLVLEKRMLVQHFMQHYEMLTTSLFVWRTVPDWTDHDHLPEYCRQGVTC